MNDFGELDAYLFSTGTHARLWQQLGAHPNTSGVRFAVWAPNARDVHVVSSSNHWGESETLALAPSQNGIWHGECPRTRVGDLYKYRIFAHGSGGIVEKADPLAFYAQVAPATASIVHDLEYSWSDELWMQSRAQRQRLDAPMSIYEVHLGSWRRVPEEGNRSLTFREIAPLLADYVLAHGFTHVEIMPIMEHPFYGSWGYQVTGFYAPTSRYGTPQDFMAFVDHLHQRGIGVILDWPPAHFPHDAHGLANFDGTHLYEHADPRQGHHPEWGSAVFNYGRNEVRSFLISNANFWLSVYHVDALRVDAVASMLYLNYARKDGEWVPNIHGGHENLEAIHFLRTLCESVAREQPGAQVIAEESTAWPMVTGAVDRGGLGFTLKWDMGFMHDTLAYLKEDPIHRRYHHDKITFRAVYAANEHFVLPFSHDEVVHGKGSLLGKMPGDEWQALANLRLLFAYMWAQPGKKLLFMGQEFGQWREWNHDRSLDWHLVEQRPGHAGLAKLVAQLNAHYKEHSALHELDCDAQGFEWVCADDLDRSVLSFLRRNRQGECMLIVLNFTPIPRYNYRVGVDYFGTWSEILNTDALEFGGTGVGNLGQVEAAPAAAHGRRCSLSLTLPPLAALYFEPKRALRQKQSTPEQSGSSRTQPRSP
jgi:1,4-alpha-glucan branching enzyme